MIVNIQDLLKELVSYALIPGSHNSFEAISILCKMKKEFERLGNSGESDKQSKMITLFIGGIICAIRYDDLKYENNIYPQTLGNTFFEAVITTADYYKLENMYDIGKKALSNLPEAFCLEIFKTLINKGQDPQPFFTKIEPYIHKIDLLTAFCIRYAGNLDTLKVVDTNDLKLVDPNADYKVMNPIRTNNISIPFSNTSMQILGGFIAILGIGAVVSAFLVLNAATFGVAGLIAASIGAAAILGGFGLFAVGTSKQCQSSPNETIDKFAPYIPV